MFSFFQTIFHKVTITVASIAVAVGLVSAPKLTEHPVDVKVDVKSDAVVVEVKESKAANQELGTTVEQLKKKIEELTNQAVKKEQSNLITVKPTQPQVSQPQLVQPSQSKSVPPRPENSDEWTFNRDTWAWEKHPSVPPVASIISLPNLIQQTTQNQITNLQIISVQVKTDVYSAIIEWKTSQPAESKIFISTDNFITKVVSSESGLSSRHIANITGLLPDKNYSFEIEAIISNVSVKKSGEFRTLPLPLSSSLSSLILEVRSLKAISAEFYSYVGSYTKVSGAFWELYINNQKINSKPNDDQNANTVYSYSVQNLTPETEYSYKLVYKEPSREDSVKIGTFKTLSKRETISCKFQHNEGGQWSGELFIRVNNLLDGGTYNYKFYCNPGDFSSIKLISIDMRYGEDWNYDYITRISKFSPITIRFFNNQFSDTYNLEPISDGLIVRIPDTTNNPAFKTIALHNVMLSKNDYLSTNGNPVVFNVTVVDPVTHSSQESDSVPLNFFNLKFQDENGNQYVTYIPRDTYSGYFIK